jgi:TonB family protein
MEALKGELTGSVVLAFVVTAEGRVNDVVVEKADIPELAEAAKRQIALWQFIPAETLKNPATPQLVHMHCRITFDMTEARRAQ